MTYLLNSENATREQARAFFETEQEFIENESIAKNMFKIGCYEYEVQIGNKSVSFCADIN